MLKSPGVWHALENTAQATMPKLEPSLVCVQLVALSSKEEVHLNSVSMEILRKIIHP